MMIQYLESDLKRVFKEKDNPKSMSSGDNSHEQTVTSNPLLALCKPTAEYWRSIVGGHCRSDTV